MLVVYMILFGKKLKQLRQEKELTQQELADRLSLTRATISSYERSALYPSVEVLVEICRFFNVSADYMLGLVDVNLFDTRDLTIEQENIIRELLYEFQRCNSRK
ncbi:MAG: helix-turn-helix domain-containing protein [Oscillospiraceae bacterium]|nr:helix-turn-helix domain-containing protein [Oscillospiraceae bacterium]